MWKDSWYFDNKKGLDFYREAIHLGRIDRCLCLCLITLKGTCSAIYIRGLLSCYHLLLLVKSLATFFLCDDIFSKDYSLNYLINSKIMCW